MAMVPHVREIAQRFGAAITVLNAFELIPDYALPPRREDGCDTEAAINPYTPALQEVRKQREQRLKEFSCTQFPGLTQTARIEDGDPATVIDWVAKHENTDLIVMPTRGFGRFRRLLLGSITAKVLHDVICPVLTSAHEPEQALASPGGYRSIICALELGPQANVVLKTAGLLAQAYGARMCLLHMEPSSDEHTEQASAQSVRYAFDQAFSKEGPDVGAGLSVRVLDAAIPEGIRRAAIEERADLVVVGRGHQKGALSRAWSHLYTSSANHRVPFSVCDVRFVRARIPPAHVNQSLRAEFSRLFPAGAA